MRRAAKRSNEEQASGGGWRRRQSSLSRGSVGEHRRKGVGPREAADSGREKEGTTPRGAGDERVAERQRVRKREIEHARLFSTSTQPGWRRIAAQCSSNGAALRRDHAAAPCATDRPISGTRERKKIIFLQRAEASASE